MNFVASYFHTKGLPKIVRWTIFGQQGMAVKKMNLVFYGF